jgi:hypothetical protein
MSKSRSCSRFSPMLPAEAASYWLPLDPRLTCDLTGLLVPTSIKGFLVPILARFELTTELPAAGVLGGGACKGWVEHPLPLGRFGVGPCKLDARESKDSASCISSSSSYLADCCRLGVGTISASLLRCDLVELLSFGFAEKPITFIRRPICCCASENSLALVALSSRRDWI